MMKKLQKDVVSRSWTTETWFEHLMREKQLFRKVAYLRVGRPKKI